MIGSFVEGLDTFGIEILKFASYDVFYWMINFLLFKI